MRCRGWAFDWHNTRPANSPLTPQTSQILDPPKLPLQITAKRLQMKQHFESVGFVTSYFGAFVTNSAQIFSRFALKFAS